MGYELNKLMAQFGVSSPVLPYSGGLAGDDKAAMDAYKTQYQQRIQDTPVYAAPSNLPPPRPAPGATPPPPPVSTPFQAPPAAPPPPPARQMATAPGGGGIDAMNQTIKDWYRANPNASPDQVKALQAQYGVTNRDLYGATGNYWGNTLKPPVFGPATPAAPATVAAPQLPNPKMPTVEELNAQDMLSPDQQKDMGQFNNDRFAQGGVVKTHFEDGGFNDLSSRYTDNSEEDQGLGGTAPQSRRASMEDLLAKYATQPSAYGAELKTARETASKEQKAFQDLLERQMAGQSDAGPSKSEMYFRLAAALGAPTKSGHFGEAMGNAASAMADYQKDVRDSQKRGEANKLALGMKAQESRMQGSKDDVTALRGLAGSEMQAQKEMAGKLMADYLKSGQPQSEAGKIAVDKGLKPGTPEFNKDVDAQIREKIDSGNMIKQAMLQVAQSNAGVAQAGLALRENAQQMQMAEKAKLTPQEMKMKAETELALTTMADAYKDLKEVERLNPNTYDNSLVDQAQYKALAAVGSKDPKVVNTGVLNNILKQGALSTASTTLKTQISDADIKMLQGLQGIDAKSQQERAEVVKAAKRRMLEIYKVKKLQLQDINAGKYRLTQPTAPAELQE